MLVCGFLEREAGGEFGVKPFVQRKSESFAGLAPCVQVEQFRGHVTNLLGGLAAGLFPLLAAEPVQRGAFGVAAGIAADQVKRGNRHVQLVAAGVFQLQELGRALIDFQRLQAHVAANTVILVNDRRAFRQVREVADNGVRIALADGAFYFGTAATAEQLGFGQQGKGADIRIAANESLVDRKHGQAKPVRAVYELGEAIVLTRTNAKGGQRGPQHFTASRCIGRKEHPSVKVVDVCLQSGGRVLATFMDRQVRRWRSIECRAGRRRVIRAGQVNRIALFERQVQLFGAEKQFLRVQHRPFNVVPPLLPTFTGPARLVFRRIHHPALQNESRCVVQVVQQERGLLVKQRQVLLQALRMCTAAQVLVQRDIARIDVKAQPERAAKGLQAFLVTGVLARGQQFDRIDLAGRALGLGVETANTVDLFVKKVDTVRIRTTGRIQINYRTTHGVLAGLVNLLHVRVTGVIEFAPERVDDQVLPGVQTETALQDIVGRRQPLHQGSDRAEYDPLLKFG